MGKTPPAAILVVSKLAGEPPATSVVGSWGADDWTVKSATAATAASAATTAAAAAAVAGRHGYKSQQCVDTVAAAARARRHLGRRRGGGQPAGQARRFQNRGALDPTARAGARRPPGPTASEAGPSTDVVARSCAAGAHFPSPTGLCQALSVERPGQGRFAPSAGAAAARRRRSTPVRGSRSSVGRRDHPGPVSAIPGRLAAIQAAAAVPTRETDSPRPTYALPCMPSVASLPNLCMPLVAPLPTPEAGNLNEPARGQALTREQALARFRARGYPDLVRDPG